MCSSDLVSCSRACAKFPKPVFIECAYLDTNAAGVQSSHTVEDEYSAIIAERDVVGVVESSSNRLIGIESDGLQVFHGFLFDKSGAQKLDCRTM